MSTTKTEALHPNQIVRLKEARLYFGYGHSRIAEMIDSGEIPKPIALGERSRGWLGSQIIEWQQQRLEAAAKAPKANRPALAARRKA